MNNEEKKAKRLRENLEMLQGYKLMTETGRVVIMPVITKEGVRWDSKVFMKGVSGHVGVSKESLERIDSPDAEEWLNKIAVVIDQLRAHTPDQIDQVTKLLESLPDELKKDTILIE